MTEEEARREARETLERDPELFAPAVDGEPGAYSVLPKCVGDEWVVVVRLGLMCWEVRDAGQVWASIEAVWNHLLKGKADGSTSQDAV